MSKIKQSISNVHTGDRITYTIKYPEKYYTVVDPIGTITLDGDLVDIIEPQKINPINIEGKPCNIPFFSEISPELKIFTLKFDDADENEYEVYKNEDKIEIIKDEDERIYIDDGRICYKCTYGEWIKTKKSNHLNGISKDISSSVTFNWSVTADEFTASGTIQNIIVSSNTEYIISKELSPSDFSKSGELRLIQFSNPITTDNLMDEYMLYRNGNILTKDTDYTVNNDNIIVVKNCEDGDVIKFEAIRCFNDSTKNVFNRDEIEITITSDMINNPNTIELTKFDFNDLNLDIDVKNGSNENLTNIEFYYPDSTSDQQYLYIYTKIFPTISYSKTDWINVYENKKKYWDSNKGCYTLPIWPTSENSGTTDRSVNITISADGYNSKTVNVKQLAPIWVTFSFSPKDITYTVASNLTREEVISFDAATVSINQTSAVNDIKPKYTIFDISGKNQTVGTDYSWFEIKKDTEPKIYIDKSKAKNGTYYIIITASISHIDFKKYKCKNTSEFTNTFICELSINTVRVIK